jgi:hypothetical protein
VEGGRLIEILHHLELLFTHDAHAMGFRLADRECADDFEWIDYRRVDASGTAVLSLSHARGMQTVTAEVWWPDRLAERNRAGAPGSAIEHQQFWNYASSCDPGRLAGEIIDVVVDWISVVPRDFTEPVSQVSSAGSAVAADDAPPFVPQASRYTPG